jgi:hypothetical protein
MFPDVKTLRRQRGPDTRSQLDIQASEEDALTIIATFFPVDRHDAACPAQEEEAHGLVEAGARDMEGAVSRSFQSLEGVEGPSLSRDVVSDLGGSGLDSATMRRDDRERRLRSANQDTIVDAGSLVLLQRGEVRIRVRHESHVPVNLQVYHGRWTVNRTRANTHG